MSDENEKQVESTDNNSVKGFSFKISKKNIYSFIAGVLVTSILILGGLMVTDSSSLTGMAIFGTSYEENMPVVTKENFQAEVIESDKPVLVYYAHPGFNSTTSFILSEIDGGFDGDIKKYTVLDIERVGWDNYSVPYLDADIQTFPTLLLFNKGKLVGQKDFILPMDIILWTNSIVNNKINNTPTPRPTRAPTMAPAPTPVVPAFYKAFPKTTISRMIISNNKNISELSILPFSFEPIDFTKCEGIHILVKDNIVLYALLQNTFGGNDEWFGIPDLKSQAPLEGLNYYINTNGIYPRVHDGDEAITKDGINYFSCPYIDDDLLIGEIILAKNIDENAFPHILPCDGRELKIFNNQALFSLIANKFGGDGKQAFKLPDMSKANPPIDGAKYYITIEGVYPSRK